MQRIKSTRFLLLNPKPTIRTTPCLRTFGLTIIIFCITILNRNTELISVITL
nr:MAG TPA: hypothetical protein [Caudoviricetes sp.]